MNRASGKQYHDCRQDLQERLRSAVSQIGTCGLSSVAFLGASTCMGNRGTTPPVLGTVVGTTLWWGLEVWGLLLGGCLPSPTVFGQDVGQVGGGPSGWASRENA